MCKTDQMRASGEEWYGNTDTVSIIRDYCNPRGNNRRKSRWNACKLCGNNENGHLATTR